MPVQDLGGETIKLTLRAPRNSWENVDVCRLSRHHRSHRAGRRRARRTGPGHGPRPPGDDPRHPATPTPRRDRPGRGPRGAGARGDHGRLGVWVRLAGAGVQPALGDRPRAGHASPTGHRGAGRSLPARRQEPGGARAGGHAGRRPRSRGRRADGGAGPGADRRAGRTVAGPQRGSRAREAPGPARRRLSPQLREGGTLHHRPAGRGRRAEPGTRLRGDRAAGPDGGDLRHPAPAAADPARSGHLVRRRHRDRHGRHHAHRGRHHRRRAPGGARIGRRAAAPTARWRRSRSS